MKLIPVCSFLLLTFSMAFAQQNTAPAGYTTLFNGEDFSGWKVPVGDNGH